MLPVGAARVDVGGLVPSAAREAASATDAPPASACSTAAARSGVDAMLTRPTESPCTATRSIGMPTMFRRRTSVGSIPISAANRSTARSRRSPQRRRTRVSAGMRGPGAAVSLPAATPAGAVGLTLRPGSMFTLASWTVFGFLSLPGAPG